VVPEDPLPLRENVREGKRRQEQSGTALGAPLPHEHADRDCDEREREVDDGPVLDDLRLVDRTESQRHRCAERPAGCPHEQANALHAASPTSAASAATVRSRLEMKPVA
jgi:hypothetical protein